MGVFDWLRLPETRGVSDLDDPATTLLHARIVRKKGFLRRLYFDFYDQFRKSVPHNARAKLLVELGSGGGFIKEVIPNVITSDIIDLPHVDRRFSALDMPFEDGSVDAIFMIDVLHHLPDARAFFAEACRCLKTGGKLVMIEPANTCWSRFIFQNFHHEPFDPSGKWGVESKGPLSSANGAIPWIIFYRDRAQFEREFPSLRIIRLRPHTPLRYLISGGFRTRQLLPSFGYNPVKALEAALSPFENHLGMFLTIELEKTP